ncbi:class I SAM-dependent methyltransferase [Streptomyces sp. NBC_01207]|uniref:class I SAM-dependent methyltransferase n=1 Tax=Streptomyces sp. NBC_01207 TaxID=2903772 RepID=UPI002E148E5A|nr:class I SAM-dependent methyltransferase [Streptomyces sp. NBC_01207]
MNTAEPSPALTPAEQARQDGYNALHTARAASPLPGYLYAAALGDAYPAEIAASSSCDWPLIGTMVANLRIPEGSALVDLGCGTGGIGLWLARALNVPVVGIDISPRAVELAAARTPAFLPPGRAVFRVGTVERTGLPDASAGGVVCVDALSHASDRAAALAEIRRILTPGGRAVVTGAVRRDTEPVWHHQAEAAGLHIEDVQERPDEPAMWRRLYQLWQARADDLARHLGEDQACAMLAEAARRRPTLAGRRAVALTFRRPLRCTDAPTTLESR